MLIRQFPLAYTLRKDILVIGLLLENSRRKQINHQSIRFTNLTFIKSLIDIDNHSTLIQIILLLKTYSKAVKYLSLHSL